MKLPRLSMIAYIIIGAVVGIPAIIAAVASTRPDTFRCKRSITINAPPSTIYPLINEIKNGESWGPWFGLDPKMKTTYEGPASGVGASYSWDGNNEVGAGRCTTIETKDLELVRQKLEFIRPFAGVNTVDFTLKPEGDKTVVTWDMYGPSNFIGKVMSLFIDCDKMCGDMFTKGLVKMKSVAETGVAQNEPQLAPAGS